MEKRADNMQYYGPYGLYNPFLLGDMDNALKRVIKAVNERQKIVIYGYCDLDSITAVSLLVLILKYLNADVEYYIPDCNSFGISAEAVKNSIKFLGSKLMITVGCGMDSHSEVELCKSLGIDVIITDYHKCSSKQPDTITINPNLECCIYPFKELSASGVAFKLVQAISTYYQMKSVCKYLDMVMLGTIAQCTSLNNENKTIVDHGLYYLTYTHNYGLQALMKIHNIKSSNINIESARRLSLDILPSTNRIADNARIAVELFTTSNMDRAEQIAKFLKNTTKLNSPSIC